MIRRQLPALLCQRSPIMAAAYQLFVSILTSSGSFGGFQDSSCSCLFGLFYYIERLAQSVACELMIHTAIGVRATN